jgi:hypothetical protein
MTKNDLEKEKAVRRAENCLCPISNPAATINSIYGGSLDLRTISKELITIANRTCNGNLGEAELILIGQAKTLDALFHRSLTEMIDASFVPNMQALADIALRAQNQSRRTLATLAELKSPKRATFIKQQNNAINQQVNNPPKNSKISENLANELVSETLHEKMDIGRTIETVSTSKRPKDMAALDRSEDDPRESQEQNECV